MPLLSLHDLDTPALVVELDALDHNVATIGGELRAAGKQWRPHVKSHRSPELWPRLKAAGAIGVTVARVATAETFARVGCRDILIAHCLADLQHIERMAALCTAADPIVCCDHFAQAELLAAACLRRGVTCRVLIEINLGLHRTGVRPGPDTWELARSLAQLKGIRPCGVMGYEGHLLTIPHADRKRDQIQRAMTLLHETAQSLERSGMCIEIISAGGTGSYQHALQSPGITELQAGGGIFGDPFYTDACGVTGLRPALGIVATVVSRPSLPRAVLNCGRKSLSPEIHAPQVIRRIDGHPLPDAKTTQISAEHWTLELGPGSRDITIGDRVLLRPGYGDLTIGLHQTMHGIRAGHVAESFPIGLR
ncbi:MAG: alanine racemase [Planctomycetaceae bacterium]